MNVRLIGLVSCYREGELIQQAIRSLIGAVDHVYVYEGPAGEPIDADVPDTDLGIYAHEPRVTYRQGRWRTDARKRTAIVKDVRDREGEELPLWGIWLDGDEVLVNGEYLRDYLQVLQWHDELHPDDPPHMGKPLMLVELDGSVASARGRTIRLDLLRHFDVSTATFTNSYGVAQGAGNFAVKVEAWEQKVMPHLEAGTLVLPPPLPTEPFVVHRSILRHPLRAGYRMHHQEARELERIKSG